MIPEQPLLTKVKSQLDRKGYFVSTAKNNVGAWETAVIERGFLGKPKLLTPVRVVNSWTFEDAYRAHVACAEAATTQSRASWENTKGKILFTTIDKE